MDNKQKRKSRRKATIKKKDDLEAKRNKENNKKNKEKKKEKQRKQTKKKKKKKQTKEVQITFPCGLEK